MNEICQAISEELRPQDSDDGQNDEQPSQKHYTLRNFVVWSIIKEHVICHICSIVTTSIFTKKYVQ